MWPLMEKVLETPVLDDKMFHLIHFSEILKKITILILHVFFHYFLPANRLVGELWVTLLEFLVFSGQGLNQ